MTEQEIIVLQANEIYDLKRQLSESQETVNTINGMIWLRRELDKTPAEVLDDIYRLINGR